MEKLRAPLVVIGQLLRRYAGYDRVFTVTSLTGAIFFSALVPLARSQAPGSTNVVATLNTPAIPATPAASSVTATMTPGTNSGHSAQQNAASQIVTSYIDPRTGIIYDRYQELVSSPSVRWEMQEVVEKHFVPQTVNRTVKVTQTEYQATYVYQPQQQVYNRWNPLATPQVQTQYVPQVQYQPVHKVVDQVVPVQEYVEREVKRMVPKLVQSTESRYQYIDRPRSGAPAAIASGAASPSNVATSSPAATLASVGATTNYPTTPIVAAQPTAYQTNVPLGYNPINSVAVGTPVYRFTPSTMPTTQPQVLTAPLTTAAPGLTPMPAATASRPFAGLAALNPFAQPVTAQVLPATVAPATVPATTVAQNTQITPTMTPLQQPVFSAPQLKWPNWLTSNGPIFKSSIFKEDRSYQGITPPINASATAGGSLSVMPSTMSSAPLASRQFVNNSGYASQATLQSPGTQTATPYSVPTNRTAEQLGMPATVLR